MNDQRQVIFSQRLKILKEQNINETLKDFFDEVLNNLNIVRANFQKSGDEKNYLAETKTITGNMISDKRLLELGALKEADFNKNLKDLFSEKKNSRIKILGDEQNSNLEKNIFTNNRFFLEISSTIFRTIKTSNWFKDNMVKKIRCQNLKKKLLCYLKVYC